ncbi:MAG: hypothetical protein HY784_15505 [Chloroflexi bacterium]|nr:hypothetical protein [Chloroflexota bacterium]
MAELLVDRKVGDLTVGELKRVVREVLEEIRPRWFRDSEGFLAFLSEADYRNYLGEFRDKRPGEIQAYYLTPDGYKVRYSDWTLAPEAEERLAESLRQAEAGEVRDLEEIAAELGLEE